MPSPSHSINHKNFFILHPPVLFLLHHHAPSCHASFVSSKLALPALLYPSTSFGELNAGDRLALLLRRTGSPKLLQSRPPYYFNSSLLFSTRSLVHSSSYLPLLCTTPIFLHFVHLFTHFAPSSLLVILGRHLVQKGERPIADRSSNRLHHVPERG